LFRKCRILNFSHPYKPPRVQGDSEKLRRKDCVKKDDIGDLSSTDPLNGNDAEKTRIL
jgi:hypothetical protein